MLQDDDVQEAITRTLTFPPGDEAPLMGRYTMHVPITSVKLHVSDDGSTSTTCQLVLRQGGDQVHTEMLSQGDVAFFRNLELTFDGSDDDGALTFRLHVSPFLSVVPMRENDDH